MACWTRPPTLQLLGAVGIWAVTPSPIAPRGFEGLLPRYARAGWHVRRCNRLVGDVALGAGGDDAKARPTRLRCPATCYHSRRSRALGASGCLVSGVASERVPRTPSAWRIRNVCGARAVAGKSDRLL